MVRFFSEQHLKKKKNKKKRTAQRIKTFVSENNEQLTSDKRQGAVRQLTTNN